MSRPRRTRLLFLLGQNEKDTWHGQACVYVVVLERGRWGYKGLARLVG